MEDNPADSCIYSLDQELSASVKKVLLQRIVFKDAQIPDAGYISSHKYKPLNVRFKQHASSSRQSSQNSPQQSDIPKPLIVIYPPDRVELEWKEMRRIGPGLANLGNTCFLNSVLQVLTYTPPLVNYFLSGYHKNKCSIVGFCMQCELSNHINKVVRHNIQSGAMRPMSIIQKLQCIGKNFRFGRQEDAHEFLRYVVEAIQKSDYAGKPKMDKFSKETTVANAIFGGFYRSQVKCLHCHYESNTFDPMMDLNIDIKDCSSIMQGLQRSVRPDRLDGENKYFCEKCRTKRIAQKRGNIHKEPNVLTLQLKRFDFTKMFGGKICKEISFPEELNIRPFMSNNQGEPVFYKLYGILVHSGFSCNSGHYYCYVKAPNGTWYEMNDNRVTQVGLQKALQAQAYILFYIKSNQSKSVANVPQAVAKGGTLKSVAQRPEMKPFGISSLDKQRSNNHHGDPLGVLLKKKPKINWTHNNIQGEKLSTVNLPQNKRDVNENGDNPNKARSVSLANGVTSTSQSPDSEKRETLNGLQKLSQLYSDSDGVESRGPSPTSCKQTEVSNQEKKENKQMEKIPVVPTTTLPSQNGNVPNSKKETNENRPPFKLKLKDGKQFIHNKFNIWSPVTKGTLYPRAILNKCVFGNENDPSKVQIFEKKKKLTEVDSLWKEEKMPQSDRLFGPLMPPPQGTICKGSSSITSETSSTGSIQTQSGEWDVLDKPCEPAPPVVVEPKHTGWNVHPASPTSSIPSTASVDESSAAVNEIEGSKAKKKKKKRKRRHHNEEMISGEVQVKLLSINKRKDSLHNVDDNVENNIDLKKDRRNETIQLKSTVSLPLPLHALSDAEKVHHKKKKKKHKRRYSLVIDTNENNVGKTYNIPFEVKSSSKSEIISNGISSSTKNEYKSNGHINAYSPRIPVTLSTQHPASKEYEISKSCNIDTKNVYLFPNRTDRQTSKEKSKSPRGNTNQSETVDNNNETMNKMHDSKNNSLLQVSDKQYNSTSGGIFNRSKTGSEYNLSSVVNKTAENSGMLRETNKNTESFIKSTINVTKSYSPLKRDDVQTIKITSNEVEHISPRKRDVPTHVWDDTKKKHCAWDGTNKSDTVGYLLSGGSKVKSWDGNERSYIYNKRKNDDGENPQDEWDEEYDKGQTRKKRKLNDEHDHYKSKSNSFQDYQNYRNKDKHASSQSTRHRHPDHHQHKRRKLYSDKYNENNRFL